MAAPSGQSAQDRHPGGRNGGLLREGDRLFRAGQGQGFDRYGVGIRIYEICALPAEG